MDQSDAQGPGMFMAEVDSVNPMAPYPRIHKHEPKKRRQSDSGGRPEGGKPEQDGLTDDQGQRSDDDDNSLVDDYA